MHSGNPRRTAFDILLRIDKERSYADILLDHALSQGDIQGPDRGLLTELVYGILRRQGTLDYLIGRFSTTKVAKLERAVLILLRLGLYQALFLDRVPVSAAVNETVKLAKVLTPRASGFINAVLRRADRERNTISYPDRDRYPVRYISARFSQPEWLIQDWVDQMGISQAELLAEAMVAQPPLTIRANTLVNSREELLARLALAGIKADPTVYAPHGVQLPVTTAPARLPGFSEGWFTIQDESSQLAALLLDPQPGDQVLDLCAAPGGKATYLAQLMENRGSVIACDIDSRKLRFIEETATRLGITIISTMHADGAGRIPLLQPEQFDRVLVDAPCSGLGVLRRHPEGKWWKRPEDIAALAQTQQAILHNAAGYVKSAGTLLYATCSTSRTENEDVVDNFLLRHSDFVLEDLQKIFTLSPELFTRQGCLRSWPHRHVMDGFFAARLRKE